MKKKDKLVLNLQLFDGEGAGDGAASAETGVNTAAAGQMKGRNPLSEVRYGKQEEEVQDAAAQEPDTLVTTKSAEERAAEFEQLIKGDYKDLFDSRVQNIVQNRLKSSKAAEEQLNGLRPVLDLLSSKYGVDATNIEALSKAVDSDNSFWEDEAAKEGMTVEQLKEMHRMRRENEQFRRAQEEIERQKGIQQIQAKWNQESEETKRFYPSFDFEAETQNSSFIDLLKAGVDVKTAYEVVHKDDIIGGAMQFTAQEVKQKVVNDIQARGKRPAENGISSQAGVVTKKDVNSLTRKDREEIERRVMRGERISF